METLAGVASVAFQGANMILRDVTFSEERRILSGSEATPLPVIARLVSSAPEELFVRSPTSIPVEAPLTVERILAWLELQNEEVRIKVANGLAPELDNIRARAVEEGQIVGANIAAQEVQSRFENVFAALQTLVKQADALFVLKCEELTQECVTVVDEALAKMLGEAMREPGTSLTAVRQAVSRISGARDITIRVNANELEILESKRTEIAACLGSDAFLLMADARVSSGGCLVESSFGEIDARWESQLAALIRTLNHHDATSGDTA